MGLLKFIRKFDPSEKIQEALDQDLGDITLLMETEIAEATPVVTGRLKGSMVGRRNPQSKTNLPVGNGLNALEFEVATNVEYAPFVEYGTSRFSGRAMMRRGAAKIEARGLGLFRRVRKLKTD